MLNATIVSVLRLLVDTLFFSPENTQIQLKLIACVQMNGTNGIFRI